MKVFEAISEQIGELKSSPDFKVRNSQTGLVPDYASKAEVLRLVLESVTDVKCPPGVLEALCIDGELGVYWEHEDQSEDTIDGEYILRSPILFMGESRLDEVFFDELFDGVDLRNTRTFDYSGYSGKGMHGLLEIKDKELVDEVLLFDERKLYRLGLTFLEYVELVRRTRGIAFWQLLFCEGVDRRSELIGAVERGLEFLSRQFPGEGFTDLFERLKLLKSTS